MQNIEWVYNRFFKFIRSPRAIFELLLKLFIISIPFSRRVLIYSSPYGNSHLFDPFSSIFIYLGDVFLILALFFFGFAVYLGELDLRFFDGAAQRFFWIFLLTLFLLFLGSVIPGQDYRLVFFSGLRLTLFLFVFYLLGNGYLELKLAIKLLLVGMLFQAPLVIYQYFAQQSWGLDFLGEVRFDQSTLGIAKIDYQGEKIIRGYGTFLHPNVLGGFALFSAIFSYYFWKKEQKITWLLAVGIFGAVMFLSFSRSAFIGLAVAYLIYLFFVGARIKKFISLKGLALTIGLLAVLALGSNLLQLATSRLAFSADDKSISSRLDYMELSYKQILSQPFGSGAGHFTMIMQEYTPLKLLPWERQPVHNVFLLIASELGLQATILVMAFLLWLGYSLMSRNQGFLMSFDRTLSGLLILFLFSALVIGFFDHYLLTNNSALALLTLCAAICVRLLDGSSKVIRRISF